MRVFKKAILGTAVVFLSGCLTGCFLLPKEKLEEIPALVVPQDEELVTHTVTEGPIDDEKTGSARVGSSREKKLYSLIPGRVNNVLAEEGDMVKMNQALVCLETEDLDYSIRQAEANLKQEELRYESQYGENSDAKKDIQLAEMNVTRAKLDLEQAKDKLLTENPMNTGIEKKILQRDSERAELIYNQSKIVYDRLKSQNASNSSSQQIASLGVERAKIELERLKNKLDHSVLRAPFDGKILLQKAVRGKYIEAFDTVLTIASMKGLELISEVDSASAKFLKTGMPVQVEDDDGKYHSGFIFAIHRSEDLTSSESYLVHIGMKDSNFPLQMDKSYAVKFILKSVKKTLQVPNDAVREDMNGKKYLRVLEGKKRHDVYVETGIQTETITQIKEGATNGMIVIGK